MVLYTTVPIEIIMEGFEPPPEQYLDLDIGSGARVLVERISPTEGKITRLISTDPCDYLQEAYQPGQIIKFIPQIS